MASTRFSPWRNFYLGREGVSYRDYVGNHYAPFIGTIQSHIQSHDTVLEVGCGMGTITWWLWKGGHQGTLVCIDKDRLMAEHAREKLNGKARVFTADMLTCAWMGADVIHGHGVLEHLSDHDIYRTLEAHRKTGARIAIHYVPGLGHRQPSFGDERLMPLSWWTEKWDTTDAFTFNDGKDYVLIWRF